MTCQRVLAPHWEEAAPAVLAVLDGKGLKIYELSHFETAKTVGHGPAGHVVPLKC